MRTHFHTLSAGLGLRVEFIHFAPYSPALNPVEYIIHWIRQHSLHQADCRQHLEEVKDQLLTLLDHKVVFTHEQLVIF